MRGSTVCNKHGGTAPQIVAAAQRRLDAQEAREFAAGIAARYGHVEPLDPREILELELWRTHVQVMVYDALCGELALDEGGIYNRTYHHTGDPTGEAKPHVLIVMRDEKQVHLARVAAMAAKAGIDVRRMEIEQGRAQVLADAVRSVFGSPELGLSREQQQRAGVLVAAAFRQIEAGA